MPRPGSLLLHLPIEVCPMHKGRQAPKTDVGRGWSVVAANSRPGPLPLHCRSRPAQCTRRGRGWSVLAANSPLPLHLPIEACTMHNVRRAPHHRRRTRLVRLGRRSPALGLFLYTCLIEASQCLDTQSPMSGVAPSRQQAVPRRGLARLGRRNALALLFYRRSRPAQPKSQCLGVGSRAPVLLSDIEVYDDAEE